MVSIFFVTFDLGFLTIIQISIFSKPIDENEILKRNTTES